MLCTTFSLYIRGKDTVKHKTINQKIFALKTLGSKILCLKFFLQTITVNVRCIEHVHFSKIFACFILVVSVLYGSHFTPKFSQFSAVNTDLYGLVRFV